MSRAEVTKKFNEKYSMAIDDFLMPGSFSMMRGVKQKMKNEWFKISLWTGCPQGESKGKKKFNQTR